MKMSALFNTCMHDMKNELETVFASLEIYRIKGQGEVVEEEDKKIVEDSLNSFKKRWDKFCKGIYEK